MKKVLASLFIFLFCTSTYVFADDDMWENFGHKDSYHELTPVSEKEFEDALKQKTGNRRNKKIPKGNELYQSNESDLLKDTKQELPVICIPMQLRLTKNAIIPIGHYQVVGEKRDDKTYLRFYQSHSLIAEIPAIETDSDYEQEAVNFIDLKDINNHQVMIIFGSMDFNAYSILDIAE